MARPDQRLLRQLPAARRYLVVVSLLGAGAGLLIITQADLLAGVLARGFHGAGPAALAVPLAALATVVALRAGLAWVQEVAAQRAAAAVKADLRHRVLARTQELGPARLAGQRAGELVTMVGRGLDALDPYFTTYLPRLVFAAVVPVAVLVRLVVADWSSAAIIVVTLPLIPVFAVLVGWHTRARTERQWGMLSRLGGHFLDVVAGLATLRVFGRAGAQAGVVRRMADEHRRATMRVLRVAFLSALVLELVATLSVALVAVPVGLRLLGGALDLRTALLVLLLAPEAYLPLRAAGTAFHASVEGVAVAERAFATLDERGSEHQRGTRVTVPFASTLPRIRVEDVTVTYPGRERPALDGASLTVASGERLALVGPSGAGKSTLLALLLGFTVPQDGRVRVGGLDLAGLDLEAWRRRLAWVPQRPHLFAGTVADNIALGAPRASREQVREAAQAAAAGEFVAALPDGYDTVLGEGGTTLSAGQRQRIALARAFCRDAPLLLLDEPTARLDARNEAEIVGAAVQRLMTGRTALIVTHRPALLECADRIVTVRDGRVHTAQPAGVPDDHPKGSGSPVGLQPEPLRSAP